MKVNDNAGLQHKKCQNGAFLGTVLSRKTSDNAGLTTTRSTAQVERKSVF